MITIPQRSVVTATNKSKKLEDFDQCPQPVPKKLKLDIAGIHARSPLTFWGRRSSSHWLAKMRFVKDRPSANLAIINWLHSGKRRHLKIKYICSVSSVTATVSGRWGWISAASPQRSRQQRWTGDLRKRMKVVRKQFKCGNGCEKGVLRKLWQHLNREHNTLNRTDPFGIKKRRIQKPTEMLFKESFQFPRRVF